MINAKVNHGKVECSIKGKTTEIAAEVCRLIRGIYKGINSENPKDAAKFKSIIEHEISDSVFDEKFDDSETLKTECKEEEKEEDSDDPLKKLIESLEKLKEALEK